MIVLGLLGLAASAEAEEQESNQIYWMCESGPAVRTIRFEQQAGICRTFYTKEGVDKQVGKSTTKDVCLQVVNRIKGNLEAGNWKCRDISQTRVSSSTD